MSSKKINLNELRVKSFVTDFKERKGNTVNRTVKGGSGYPCTVSVGQVCGLEKTGNLICGEN